MKQKKIKTFDELNFFPTGSNWKHVLLEVYRHSPHNYGESHKVGSYDDKHLLAKKLKISGFELGLAISFLRDHKLIKDNNPGKAGLNSPPICPEWSNRILLTDRGFEIATKLENELSNERTQKVVMIFTAIIAWTGFTALLNEIMPDKISIVFWIYVPVIILLLSSFYFNTLIDKFKRFIFKRQINSGGCAI